MMRPPVPPHPLGLEPARFAGVSAGSTCAARSFPVRVVAATVAGNALEFYDFTVYAFFAVYIGQTFFPARTPFRRLLLLVGVFGVGFVSRPLGGVLIGSYADKAGRKPAMLTIALITVVTVGLALTPSYAAIGMAAPLVVVACRVVQGLALGGEVGPASAFLIEAAPSEQRGLYASWQIASQGIAVFAAGAFGLALSVLLSPADPASWGRRVPFVLCLALVPVAVFLRRAMPETLGHRPTTETPGGSPLRRARLGDYRGLIALAVLAILGGAVSTYVGYYMTTYGITTLHLPGSTALAAAVVGGLSTLVFALVGGRLSDRYGRRPVMLVPRVLLAILIYPLFLLIAARPGAVTLLTATATIAALTAASGAASLAASPELLPGRIRATGFLGCLCGRGLSVRRHDPLRNHRPDRGNGDPTSPAWYVAVTSITTTAAMWALPESRGRVLKRLTESEEQHGR